VKLLPLQTAVLQACPLLTLPHAPAPSQLPSLPHGLVAVSSLQASCGSLPSSTGAHVPSAFPVKVREQALQPVQAVAQQTPSTQWPSSHSLSWAHGTPTPPDDF
jgi:hypothetical protein